jgi:hypothetical protein
MAAVGLACGAGGIPEITVLLRDEISECGTLGDVTDEDVRVIYAANFVEADALVPQLAIEPIHHLIGLLRDCFLHLDLNNQVRAALQVKAKLDLMTEVILDLPKRGGKRRIPDQHIDRGQNDNDDKYYFPL